MDRINKMNTTLEFGNKYLVEHEKELIDRAVSGDQKAFRELFHAYREMVYRVVYRFLGDADDVEDAVQQTFIEVHRSLPGYEAKAKLTTWLYRIAINVSIQFLRKKKYLNKFDSVDPEIVEDSDGRSSFEDRELKDQVRMALSKLPLKKRIVVILHDLEGITMEEIADIRKIPLGTVKSRLFHGREELKKKLSRYLFDYEMC
ncbi:MAG: sigma-70 family RNA polymerase sigma factor [Fibrobacter sp.]|nr:sigma-70 family RNA polymerase sigma factor [Fibrobacter sp.]